MWESSEKCTKSTLKGFFVELLLLKWELPVQLIIPAASASSLDHKYLSRGAFWTSALSWTDLCGLNSLCVGQPDALPEVGEQIPGQSAPSGSRSNPVGDVTLSEGDELCAGHVVDCEGRALLCGFKDYRHAAVGDKLEVQAEDEVFGVAHLEGHAFGGVCGNGKWVGWVQQINKSKLQEKKHLFKDTWSHLTDFFKNLMITGW